MEYKFSTGFSTETFRSLEEYVEYLEQYVNKAPEEFSNYEKYIISLKRVSNSYHDALSPFRSNDGDWVYIKHGDNVCKIWGSRIIEVLDDVIEEELADYSNGLNKLQRTKIELKSRTEELESKKVKDVSDLLG